MARQGGQEVRDRDPRVQGKKRFWEFKVRPRATLSWEVTCAMKMKPRFTENTGGTLVRGQQQARPEARA